MIRSALQIFLVLPTALLFASPADGEARKAPKGTILCLPPGGGKPMPCAAAAAGSTIQIDTNLEGPGEIYFVEVGGGGKRAKVPARPVAGRNGSYLITMPRHLCTSHKPVNYEIQHLMSQYNQAEGRSNDAQSVGFFQMRCN